MSENESRVRSYLFSIGNSNVGSVGACARVQARSPEEALSILQDVLPEESCVFIDDPRIEYCNAYFNGRNLTMEDLDNDTLDDVKQPPEGGNVNLLEGLRCPSCRSTEPFNIRGAANFRLSDTHYLEYDGVEWGGESYIRCDNCCHEGIVNDFKVPDGHPVEFLLAWEDRSWTTEIFHVPDHFLRIDDAAIQQAKMVDWWLDKYGSNGAWRKISVVQVYSLGSR
jgi:hypothetical protein